MDVSVLFGGRGKEGLVCVAYDKYVCLPGHLCIQFSIGLDIKTEQAPPPLFCFCFPFSRIFWILVSFWLQIQSVSQSVTYIARHVINRRLLPRH